MKSRIAHLMTLLVVFALPLALGPGTASHTVVPDLWTEHDTMALATPLGEIGRLPLSFVPNAGQTDSQVRFQVHAMGGTVFFTPSEMVLSLPSPAAGWLDPLGAPAQPASPATIVRVRFQGASPAAEMEGLARLPGIVNYLIGNDPAQWRTNLPTYAAVVYRGLYPGIDLRYDGKTGGLKGTYVVDPGADPDAIQLAFERVNSVEIDEKGDLILRLPHGEIRQEAPILYQEQDGVQETVAGEYVLRGGNVVGFHVADYDAGRSLMIDPSLGFSTYLGGIGRDGGSSIAVDDAFGVYVTGGTASTDFPTESPIQEDLAGEGDVFVTKLERQGTGIVYSTFIGGLETDQSSEIVVDEDGNAYVVGTTESYDFPTTIGAFDRSFAGGAFAEDAFVVKLDPTGSGFEYATYLGGSAPDEGQGIALDDQGHAYVTGNTQSEDFPTMNPYQSELANDWGYAEAFVTKLNASGSALVYSTYLGGDFGANGYDIVVDDSGQAYVTGATSSTDFPTQSAYQGTPGGGADAFVTKFNSSGTGLEYSTYLGGSNNEFGLTIALGVTDHAYVGGMTSSYNFPTSRAVQASWAGTWDGFVTQLGAGGSHLSYSTFLGGSADEQINGLALDPFGSVFVTGQTRSTDFPTAMPDQATNAGDYDAFIAKLSSAGPGLRFSTYWGGGDSDYGQGIAVDRAGNAHVIGTTYSSDFPNSPGALDGSYSDGEAFVARVSSVVGTLTGQIPPTGGTLSSSPYGVSFSFGSGAFDESVSLTCSFLEEDQATGELAGVGRVFDLSAVSSDSGQVAELAPGATYAVSITYPEASSAIEETLALYHWDGTQWVMEPTSVLDTVANTVIATPDHFSIWAVLGETRRVFLPLVLRNR